MILCPYCDAEFSLFNEEKANDCEHLLYIGRVGWDTYDAGDDRHHEDDCGAWYHDRLKAPGVRRYIDHWARQRSGLEPKLSLPVAHCWIEVWGHPEHEPGSVKHSALPKGNTLRIEALYAPLPDNFIETLRGLAIETRSSSGVPRRSASRDQNRSNSNRTPRSRAVVGNARRRRSQT